MTESYRAFRRRWETALAKEKFGSKEWNRLLAARYAELRRLMATDDEFAVDAFSEEYANHDANWSLDDDECLNELGLSTKDLEKDDRLARLFDQGKRRCLGTEGVPVNAETRYYIDCRMTDPTYGFGEAVKEYLYEHEDVMEGVVEQFWRDKDPDDEVFDYDVLNDIVSAMDPMDVFQMGLYSHVSPTDEWYMYDGNGNIQSVSGYRRLEIMRETVKEGDVADAIAKGDIEVPEEMAVILRMFLDSEAEKRLSVSRNIKVKGKASARKGTAKKAPAKTAKKPSTATRKASAAKTAAKTSHKTSPPAKRVLGRPGATKASTVKRPATKKAPAKTAAARRTGARR